ncbi:hypothetical protein B7H23_06395 [Notoacmeibacter marinus]|uniref:DUF6455 domain-containing protein n=1 Tax=Notoacmeibacter marinus TaxID=1876515 RepID=A0A231V3C7_9HYPH|nr:DUF6455 family protein [Notoacmeibacter marinus]OXT02521.1 hypothetical protein B7H23_06395 [Notoacmeibacter marinus]
MGFFNRSEKHGDLVGAMMDRTGALDDERILRLSDSVLRTAWFRCQGCRQADACAEFLETGDADAPTPDYCQNKALMDSLAR